MENSQRHHKIYTAFKVITQRARSRRKCTHDMQRAKDATSLSCYPYNWSKTRSMLNTLKHSVQKERHLMT